MRKHIMKMVSSTRGIIPFGSLMRVEECYGISFNKSIYSVFWFGLNDIFGLFPLFGQFKIDFHTKLHLELVDFTIVIMGRVRETIPSQLYISN